MAAKEPTTAKEMAQVQTIIGRILQVGVIFSAIVMLIGLVLFLVSGQSGYSGSYVPRRMGLILQGTWQLKPYAIMMLGVYCLILTPVLRVVVSIYAFYKEHDRLYVAITTLVLAILLVALAIGVTG
ncbi:DUF1634 domain-containing protein [Levilactobacillus brevis]|jgi:uncharacterized membrane protein|uniref:Predicted membrane protein n=3 Tax=Levilactobacillus brevis TaxID=1580 RepID=Q03TG0_LEVBA|nr:DUF1634 domain-containing protein [Levilactobacillus brevis]MBL3535928.1 DUF1634 domain-containing protein [Lactobacillus sp. GPR40-2]MBL3629285.1 DUF1634 domain-containing protein [Lactobacillus sp. GPB7-4]ABJ63512.1 Predicted membrane protein [Levilactobacillus brevis ATCC 367]ANN48293.1 hypothetical protein A6F53_03115 [Levilactobacillus brevis]ARQ93257.1 hypothetical protein A6F60_05865 [Levilactobacillus brevis]